MSIAPRAFTPLLTALALLACEPPAVRDGVFACTRDDECPAAAPRCVDMLCQRSAAGGLWESCRCEPGLFCTGTGSCVHACERAPDDCPAGSVCARGLGCVTESCTRWEDCTDGQGCAEGICRRLCALGCDSGSQCIDQICQPLRAATTRMEALDGLEPADCLAGTNRDFIDRDLEGWCSLWRSRAPSVPEPRVITSEALPLRVVIMATAPTLDAPRADRLAAFSLFQIHPLTSAADFDRAVRWDFSAAGSGRGWGVSLSLAFIDVTGRLTTYVRTWNDDQDLLLREALGDEITLYDEGATRAAHDPGPPLVLRNALNASHGAALPSPQTQYASVAIVMTVWTTGPRVELHHRSLSVTPL